MIQAAASKQHLRFEHRQASATSCMHGTFLPLATHSRLMVVATTHLQHILLFGLQSAVHLE
jgi:hypothetical protein